MTESNSTHSPEMTWEQKRWLLRFPWDWSDDFWGIALLLVEQWEHGPPLLSHPVDAIAASAREFEGLDAQAWREAPATGRQWPLALDSETEARFLALLAHLIALAAPAPGVAPRLAEGESAGAWAAVQKEVDAVAAVLRGNKAWADAIAPKGLDALNTATQWEVHRYNGGESEEDAVESGLQTSKIVAPHLRASGDLAAISWLEALSVGGDASAREYFAQRYRESRAEWRKGWEQLGDEYLTAATLAPSAALCVASADAYAAAEATVPERLPSLDSLRPLCSTGPAPPELHLKLGSLLLMRAGLNAVDMDMRSWSQAQDEDGCWEWDTGKGLSIQGNGFLPESYPISDSDSYSRPQNQLWKLLAAAVLESLIGDSLPTEINDGARPVAVKDILQKPSVLMALSGLDIVHDFGVITRYDYLFEPVSEDDYSDTARALQRLMSEVQEQGRLIRSQAAESHQAEMTALARFEDLFADATEALHRVVEGQVPSLAVAAAQAEIKKTLDSVWERLSPEVRKYLANGHALYRANIDGPESWDWGLVTIEFTKALEAVLRVALSQSVAVTSWLQLDEVQKRRPRPQLATLGISEFAMSLEWATQQPFAPVMKAAFAKEKAQWLFQTLPRQLFTVSGYRRHAAHAGELVKKSEALNVQRALLGQGDDPGLIERLLDLL
ncbi:MAG: hypothetical protein HY534_00770 [Chloroflexi bacterium]|nr:hypothetical protein [Chloroflexota bacterium]